MAGTPEGARKAAAKMIGISYADFQAMTANGMKWCYYRKHWEPKEQFGLDNNRGDKTASVCNQCRSVKSTASRYQIHPDTARAMNDGVLHCDLCGRKTKLEQDHCHATGRNRGKLCGKCNRGLGNYNDNPELLEKAAAYIRSYRG